MATTARDSVRPASVLNDDPDTISQDIEEGRDVYRPGGFHPVYIGDVYYDIRCRTRSDRTYIPQYGSPKTFTCHGDAREFVALKVLTVEGYGTEKENFESGRLAGPSHTIVELSS